MADLSLAAQAVLDAIQDELDATAELVPCTERIAAAALRAAADQVVPEKEDMPNSLAHRVRRSALKLVRFQLLTIAAELEQSQ